MSSDNIVIMDKGQVQRLIRRAPKAKTPTSQPTATTTTYSVSYLPIIPQTTSTVMPTEIRSLGYIINQTINKFTSPPYPTTTTPTTSTSPTGNNTSSAAMLQPSGELLPLPMPALIGAAVGGFVMIVIVIVLVLILLRQRSRELEEAYMIQQNDSYGHRYNHNHGGYDEKTHPHQQPRQEHERTQSVSPSDGGYGTGSERGGRNRNDREGSRRLQGSSPAASTSRALAHSPLGQTVGAGVGTGSMMNDIVDRTRSDRRSPMPSQRQQQQELEEHYRKQRQLQQLSRPIATTSPSSPTPSTGAGSLSAQQMLHPAVAAAAAAATPTPVAKLPSPSQRQKQILQQQRQYQQQQQLYSNDAFIRSHIPIPPPPFPEPIYAPGLSSNSTRGRKNRGYAGSDTTSTATSHYSLIPLSGFSTPALSNKTYSTFTTTTTSSNAWTPGSRYTATFPKAKGKGRGKQRKGDDGDKSQLTKAPRKRVEDDDDYVVDESEIKYL
ncbi:hypothetical protein BGZ65_005778 [Modicella reniformis]|uniref:Uncharacterized protein n=1 Tax=Modicella reniformis TaxID=1440133 RepID=A0A9P6IKV7_9FUNG|nr:hypothetical protein BGZ65_005778 [Modicella reniformis]